MDIETNHRRLTEEIGKKCKYCRRVIEDTVDEEKTYRMRADEYCKCRENRNPVPLTLEELFQKNDIARLITKVEEEQERYAALVYKIEALEREKEKYKGLMEDIIVYTTRKKTEYERVEAGEIQYCGKHKRNDDCFLQDTSGWCCIHGTWCAEEECHPEEEQFENEDNTEQ